MGVLPSRPGHRSRARARRRRVRHATVAVGAAEARWPPLVGSCACGGRDQVRWPEMRGRFPVLERYAYLNAGTFGPLPRATLDAMQTVRPFEGQHGRAGKPYFEEMLARRDT